MFLNFSSLSRYKLLTGGVGGEGGRGANLTTRPEKSTSSWSSKEVTSCAPNQKRINLKLGLYTITLVYKGRTILTAVHRTQNPLPFEEFFILELQM